MSDSIDTAVAMWASNCENWYIHTGSVVHRSRLAIVNSPSTSAIVSTIADSIAALRLGRITCHKVPTHLPPERA